MVATDQFKMEERTPDQFSARAGSRPCEGIKRGCAVAQPLPIKPLLRSATSAAATTARSTAPSATPSPAAASCTTGTASCGTRTTLTGGYRCAIGAVEVDLFAILLNFVAILEVVAAFDGDGAGV